MSDNKIMLPNKIYLSDYKGDYTKFIDAVYSIFERDFIKHKPRFGKYKLGLKYNPIFQDRAYTFYHMTHEGEIEEDRTPDLRRCECISWARPAIENVSVWNLKFWKQVRNGKQRICIWIENTDDVDYFVILDVRSTFVLIWTAFVAEYNNAKEKKKKEYQKWLLETNGKIYTPDSLVAEIMDDIGKKQGSPIA